MIIQGGLIINEDRKFTGDIRVEGEKIIDVKEHIAPGAGEAVVNAKGCLVIPGGVDVHTHFDMPAADCSTSDDFYTGTKAAIAGGTTTIIDFAEPDLGAPLQQGLDLWHQKADGKAFCDYSFHMTVSHWDESMPEQMQAMADQGITSFKSYTAYKDSIGVEDPELEKIMQTANHLGAVLCVHCEDGDMMELLKAQLQQEDPADIRNHPKSRPNIVEQQAVKKVVAMAGRLGAAVYIVHMSTKESVSEVEAARRAGTTVYSETCPHYLLLDEIRYHLPGFESAKYVMSPPLRSKSDQRALQRAIKNKEIDVISTDHCSFFYRGQKEIGLRDYTRIPNGIPSVEQRLELMHHYGVEKGILPERIVSMTSANPARIFGLYPQKGVIQPGSDADIVIMKKVLMYEISKDKQHQQVDYTPYEGMVITRRVQAVYLRGELVFDQGNYRHREPGGKFIPRRIKKKEADGHERKGN